LALLQLRKGLFLDPYFPMEELVTEMEEDTLAIIEEIITVNQTTIIVITQALKHTTIHQTDTVDMVRDLFLTTVRRSSVG